jgi:pimeloyl-ACP methyl ester carboxylesterase
VKIYAISGLGADERVFQFLDLPFEVVCIKWVPWHGHNLQSYAELLFEQVDTTEPFALMGVSFGGIVAVEMNQSCNPKSTILISSAESWNDFPSWYFMLPTINLVRFIPTALFNLPRPVANFLFGAKNKPLLDQILNDTDPQFVKWSIEQIRSWRSEIRLIKSVRIHGSADRIIPMTNESSIKVVPDGHHFMVADKASEVRSHVISELERINA